MGLFRKAAPALTNGLLFPTGGSPPTRGTKELIQAYREQPWLRAVTQRIASGVSCATWRLYAKTGGTEKRFVKDAQWAHGDRASRSKMVKLYREQGALHELHEHPLLAMLSAPNPMMTGRVALQTTQTHLDLKGETFWLLERNDQGMPIRYWPLPPHWVQNTPSAGAPVFQVSWANIQGAVPMENVLWFRDVDPANPYGRGTGIAESLGDELEISEFASKHIKSFFYNRAMPHAIVSFKGASPAAVKEAETRWNNQHTGFWSAFKNWFTGSEVQVERLDTAFADQQLTELRKQQHDLVREVFAVPPEVLGVIENSNRSTIDAAQFLFATGVLVPRLEFLREEIQTRLVPQFDDRLVLEYDTPVPEAREFQLSTVQAIPEAFQLNEVRAIAGFEPLKELDGLFAHHASGAESAAEGEPVEDEGDEPYDVRSDPPWTRSLRRAKV